MITQFHSAGKLRKYAEDALKDYLTASGVSNVRFLYDSREQTGDMVVVGARQSREMDSNSYRLSRYLDIEVRVLTYIDPAAADDEKRDSHFDQVQEVFQLLAQPGIETELTNRQMNIGFSTLFITGDSAGFLNASYLTTINIEALVNPKS